MVRWAPLNIPLRRRLQTAALLFAGFWFPFTQIGFALILLVPSLFPTLQRLYIRELAVLYLMWVLVLDAHTPLRGGRPTRWVRSNPMWRLIREYFPARLHTPADEQMADGGQLPSLAGRGAAVGGASGPGQGPGIAMRPHAGSPDTSPRNAVEDAAGYGRHSGQAGSLSAGDQLESSAQEAARSDGGRGTASRGSGSGAAYAPPYDPKKRYVFALHPHGVISIATLVNLVFDHGEGFEGERGVEAGGNDRPGVNCGGGADARTDQAAADSCFSGDNIGGSADRPAAPAIRSSGSGSSIASSPLSHTGVDDDISMASEGDVRDLLMDVGGRRSGTGGGVDGGDGVHGQGPTQSQSATGSAGAGGVAGASTDTATTSAVPVSKWGRLTSSQRIGVPYRILTVSANFLFPIWRDLILGSGFVSASFDSASWCLRHGISVMIVVGGALEALDARPGSADLTLKKRKGFVRLALQHGAGLVPGYSFGENELYDQIPNPPGSLLRQFQDFAIKIVGFTLPAFRGRGIFQYDYGVLPRRVPLHTVLGPAIDVPHIPHPTQADVDTWHGIYIEALQRLYNENVSKYSRPTDFQGNPIQQQPLRLIA